MTSVSVWRGRRHPSRSTPPPSAENSSRWSDVVASRTERVEAKACPAPRERRATATYWPCRSNSVRLGSSHAPEHVGGLSGLSAGTMAVHARRASRLVPIHRDRLQHDALGGLAGQVVVHRRVDFRALGRRPARRVDPVLDEVLRSEVGERAEADADARDRGRAVRLRDGEHLPHEIVHQRTLVHGSPIPSSSSAAATISSSASSTDGVSGSPIPNAHPSTPRTTTRRGARPSVRPSSSASATPTAWVDASPSRGEAIPRRRPRGEPSRPAHPFAPRPRRRAGRGPPTRRGAGSARPRSRGRRHRAPAGAPRRTDRRRRPRGTGSRGTRWRPSKPLHLEAQEVGRAGDARVVVPDRLLAHVREPVVGEVERAARPRPSGPPRSSSGSGRLAARSSRRG